MTTLKTILLSLFLVVSCPAAEPLSLNKLQQIIASAHDSKPLVEALGIYPVARRYDITVTNLTPDGQKFESKATATEKWVDGRYIVSEAIVPGLDTKITIVVEYDEANNVYRKYVLLKDDLINYNIGTRIGKSRSVSWIDLSQGMQQHKSACLTTETHTDKTTTWKSIFFLEGELQRTESGVATVLTE